MSLRLVIMGVAGSGKSSVGAGLSPCLEIPYYDGDDLHSAENVAKMAAGTPLNDDDRWPWLKRIGEELAPGNMIVGCSSLKRIYRDRIREFAQAPVQFIHLTGSRELILERMAARTGHYMPVSLLDSQFAALEVPSADESVISVDIDQPLEDIIKQILAGLKV